MKSEQTLREWIEDANVYFEDNRFDESMHALTEALALAEHQENWALCAAILAQFGRCSSSMGIYTQANYAFRRAEMMYSRAKQRPGEVEILQKFIQDSTRNEISKDEGHQLNERVEALCRDNDHDGADALIVAEKEKAQKMLGERDWYVGFCMLMQGIARSNRLSRLLSEDAELDLVRTLIDETTAYFAQAAAIAVENMAQAAWFFELVDFQQKVLAETVEALESIEKKTSGAVEDWTPDSGETGWNPDSDPDFNAEGWQPGDDNEAPEKHDRKPQQKPRRTTQLLRSWSEPFTGVKFTLSDSQLEMMDIAEQLFIRREYAQCRNNLQQVLVVAEHSKDHLLGGLTLVMMGRCCVALGEYEDGRALLQKGEACLEKLPEIGPKMAFQSKTLRKTFAEDRWFQGALTELRDEVETLCAEGNLDKAYSRCSYHLLITEQQHGETHFYMGALKALQASVSIRQAQSKKYEGEDLEQAAWLLSGADAPVAMRGHDVHWVSSTIIAEVKAELAEADEAKAAL